jgi:ADP-ribosylglycohydrolase
MNKAGIDQFDRALGALLGGALGDAMGMPTQLLSPVEIKHHYGFVEDFVAPVPDHPVSQGLLAGTITDDTEQTLLLSSVLLGSGSGFDHHAWVKALIAWEDDIRARGGYDLLGPST